MKILNRVIVLTAIIALVASTSQVALGDSPGTDRLLVVLADRQAVTESKGGGDLMSSLLGLLSFLQSGEDFVFASIDQPTETLGPAVAGELEFKTFQRQIKSSLASFRAVRDANLSDALAETYNLLGGQRAAIGSTVYLISGGVAAQNLAQERSHLASLVGLFKESGWPIVGLTLPGASPETHQLMTEISENSGGSAFELSVPNGLKSLSDKILLDAARGSLTQLGESALLSNTVLTSPVDVPPGTREMTLLFFKQDPYGSLRLSNPDGFEASAGDRTSSSVVENPHLVIWRLIDPKPGEWKVDVRGMDGIVSAWHFATNKYRLVLSSSNTVALDEPSRLVAYVMDGDEKVTLDGVRVIARISTPDGVSLVHELNDNGTSGDSVAGDGYLSATISPVAVDGEYTVLLELEWSNQLHRISSQAGFTAQAFPTVELRPVQTEELQSGKRSKVATAFVNVQGQPYAVSSEELTFDLTSNADETGILEVRPQRILDEGRAWLYDIFFTPEGVGLHTLIFRLNLEYAGRQHSFATDSIFLSSAAIPAPAPVQVKQVAPAPPMALPPLAPFVEQSGFPWGLLAVPIVAVVVLLAAAIYWLTRTQPYGYIYNDRDELLVNLSAMKRHPVMRFLFRNTVRGKELGVPGLEQVAFQFSGEEIELRSHTVAPTVRVNNQPVVGQTTLGDRSWIGTHGKLYNFLASPLMPPRFEPGFGDDD